jgi:hypothetical protein
VRARERAKAGADATEEDSPAGGVAETNARGGIAPIGNVRPSVGADRRGDREAHGEPDESAAQARASADLQNLGTGDGGMAKKDFVGRPAGEPPGCDIAIPLMDAERGAFR